MPFFLLLFISRLLLGNVTVALENEKPAVAQDMMVCMCMCVCPVCVRMSCACARACACACVHKYMCACVRVCALVSCIDRV